LGRPFHVYGRQYDAPVPPPVPTYAYGGQFTTPSSLTEFGEGGSHEANPLGGIPQGMGENGQPNLVEEGETK